MRRVVSFLVWSGCTGSVLSPVDPEEACCPGPIGPPGPTGADGAPGPVPYRWVDATGAVVTEGPDLLWIDPLTGHVWEIDAETGDYVSGSDSAFRFYESTNCVGVPHVLPYPPRVPFRIDGPGSLYYVRADWDPVEAVCPLSLRDGTGTCTSIGTCWTTEVLNELRLVSTGLTAAPVSPWVGPLHVEGG